MHQTERKNADTVSRLLEPRAGDVMLACLLVCLALGWLYAMTVSQGEEASVYVRGSRQVVSLNHDQTIELDDAVIEVENGGIRILHSNCARKICEQTGSVSHPGQTIVCAPNKILIEVKGQSKTTHHAVSY